MTGAEILFLLLVAAVASAICQVVGGCTASGYLISIVFGFAGALIGAWVADVLDLTSGGWVYVEGRRFPIAWTLGGAIFFAALGKLIAGSTRRSKL